MSVQTTLPMYHPIKRWLMQYQADLWYVLVCCTMFCTLLCARDGWVRLIRI